MKTYYKSINKNFFADILCLCGLLYFIVVALYHLHLPGVYYDEVIFAPVTLKKLENCNIQAAVSYSIGCLPVMQSPPYVGALKAILYTPVFWLLNVTPESIRLPMLIISGFVLFLTFIFTKKRLGPLPAAAILILMATDPVYIYHSRIDWGPFVLANLFKLLAVGFCLKWLEDKEVRYLGLTLLTLVLGFYDKLNFLWVIIALVLAVLIVYPSTAWQSLKQKRFTTICFIFLFLTIILVMIVRLVLPAMALNIGGSSYDLAFQIAKIRQLYKGTFSGEGLFSWLFNQPFSIFTWTTFLIWPQLIFGTVFSVSLIFWPNAPFSPGRLLAFINTILLILIVQLIATKEVGGSHHLIVLWPFHYLQLVLCGIVIADWLQSKFKTNTLKFIPSIVAIVFVLTIIFQHINVSIAYAAALDDNGKYQPRFDPVIYKLVDTLKDDPADLIVSVDWGIHQTALSMASSQQRPRYSDWWPFFMQPLGIDPKRDDWIRATYLTDKQVIFISHFPELATFPEAVANFEKYLAYWRLCPKERKIISNKEGKPFYLILRINTSNDICPTDEQKGKE